MSRRAAREAALQTLFQVDLAGTTLDKALSFVVEENRLKEKQVEFVRELLTGVLRNLDRIDRVIKEVSLEWDLQRMAGVDRNILRLALYELLFSDETPPSVAINEAVELGKAFSTAESGKFINGILGKVLSDLESYRIKEDAGV